MKIKNNYPNMVREIALTDLKLKYQGSVLGYLWSLVKPLMLFGVLYLVFGKFFKFGDGIPYYSVYLLLGIVIWSFFAEVTGICMGSIVYKGNLIRKVYFPRILLVLANSLTSFITFIINFAVVFIFMYFAGVSFEMSVLMFVPLLLELYVFALGIALILSALYVRFRDVAHIWEVFLQALFYATPILYPLSMIPPHFAKILALNPVVQIIQDARYYLISDQTIRIVDVLSFPYFIFVYIFPFILLIIGYLVFNKMSAKFAEEV